MRENSTTKIGSELHGEGRGCRNVTTKIKKKLEKSIFNKKNGHKIEKTRKRKPTIKIRKLKVKRAPKLKIVMVRKREMICAPTAEHGWL